MITERFNGMCVYVKKLALKTFLILKEWLKSSLCKRHHVGNLN